MARTYQGAYASLMTRQQAEELARKLQAEQPERHFVVRETAADDFEVASVLVPEQLRRPDYIETVDAGRQPSPADDPRTSHEQRIPGTAGGLW
jgi:hypothetical protein